jgi:hypothetical protein
MLGPRDVGVCLAATECAAAGCDDANHRDHQRVQLELELPHIASNRLAGTAGRLRTSSWKMAASLQQICAALPRTRLISSHSRAT